MFYSPKKDIQRYVALKNHQIKTLKHQLENQKITQENVQIARKKLDKLKNQYNILISQNHHQFIQSLRKTQDKKKLTQQQIFLKQKQLGLKTCQKDELIKMKNQLQEKLLKAKQSLQNSKKTNTKLLTQRRELDCSILKLTSQNENSRKQNQQTVNLVTMGHKQLNECKTKIAKNQQKCKQLTQSMGQVGSQIINQKQQLGCMRAQTIMQQLRIQNLQTKVLYLLQVKSTLLEQKQKYNQNKLIAKQRSELNKHQSMSAQLINIILNVSSAMKDNKQVEKQSCQREIKEKLIQLELSQCVQVQLSQQIKKITQNINKVQLNSSQISNKMQGLMTKDVELVTLVMKGKEGWMNQSISQKMALLKVDNNKQISTINQMKFKQSAWSKLNPIQLAKTSQDQQDVFAQ